MYVAGIAEVLTNSKRFLADEGGGLRCIFGSERQVRLIPRNSRASRNVHCKSIQTPRTQPYREG